MNTKYSYNAMVLHCNEYLSGISEAIKRRAFKRREDGTIAMNLSTGMHTDRQLP